jgi:hypothetical protein
VAERAREGADARRQALRRALEARGDRLRIVAEDLLGAETRIDWVAVAPGGELWLVLLGEAGRDLELVARGLAQRAWVEARLPDWLQLAPELGARPEAGVIALLLCPAFGPEARAAAGAVPAARLALATCHFSNDGEDLRAWIGSGDAPVARPDPAVAEPASLPPAEFRTGLSDADLGLSPEEQAALERIPKGSLAPRSSLNEIL